MQHSRLRNVLALGDAGSSPNSKTGSAIYKQASVVAAHLEAAIAGKPCRADTTDTPALRKRFPGTASMPNPSHGSSRRPA